MRQYQALTLADMLSELRRDRFTGIVSCLAKYDATAHTAKNHFLIFRFGEITYGDTVLPNISRLSDLLAQQLNHPLTPTAIKLCQEQANSSGSMRDFLNRFVATKVVTWEEVEQLIQQQTQEVLRQVAMVPGSLTQTPGQSIDICFGADEHALDWSSLITVIEAVVAETHQSQDQAQAAVLAPASTSPAPTSPAPTSPAPTSDIVPLPMAQPVVMPPSKPTVLSVDDSPIAQKMLKRSLDPHCNLLLAHSAMEALKVLNGDGSIELVFLDVNMPGVDGLEFCKAVRSIPKFKDLPIIMLTANEGLVNKLKGQIAGSTLYLNKSIEPQRLVEALYEYTSLKSLDPSTASV